MSWLMLSTIHLPLLSFGTQINDDTLTLRVKCYNGISVRPLGAVARMGSAPSFLVIAPRNANKHFWRCCQGLTIPSDFAKKCQQAFLAPLPGTASEQRYCADVNLDLVLRV